MAIDYEIYLGDQDVIDALGSVVVNLNATGAPSYEWLNTETLKAYGAPTTSMGNFIPHTDTVAYKIKSLDLIPEHDNPAATLGDAVCLSDPANCNKRGPFSVLGRKYYLDFMFMYFYNSGTEDLYSPIYSVDDSKCDENYGYFIATPSVAVNSQATAANLMTAVPKYTNDLGVLDDSVPYKFTSVDAFDEGVTSNLNIASLLILLEYTISNGQSAVVSEGPGGAGLTLAPGQYHPFILFRYVSENAPTKPINISLRFGPNVG